ncbi:mitotic-spindle organizing protein 1 [Struthio camelus]
MINNFKESETFKRLITSKLLLAWRGFGLKRHVARGGGARAGSGEGAVSARVSWGGGEEEDDGGGFRFRVGGAARRGRHGEQRRQPERGAGDDGRCVAAAVALPRSEQAAGGLRVPPLPPCSRRAGLVLFEISRLLNTGLDMETLSICVRLCEQGINPEALSSVIKELRKATEALKAAENMTG